MRIISQDGTVDMPYERMIVQISPGNFRRIIAYESVEGEEYMEIALYSTPEKARKAMEMMRNEYLKYLKVEGGAMNLSNFFVQPNVWTIPKVFLFPQEDEVE